MTAEPPAPAPQARPLRSSLITLGGNAAGQALRLVSNLLLTRLLFPEAFGLMALVLLITQGLQMISDVAIAQSIIQHKRGEEPAFLDTAWTVSVIRGVVLLLASLAVAWPMSVLYDQPALLAMVPVTALSALFQGFESTNVAVAWRRMHNGRLVLLDLGTQVAALLINVALAYTTRSVWALVVGLAGSQLLRSLASHLFLPGRRNHFLLDKEVLAHLLSFGKWIILSTFITFIAGRFDMLVLGKLVSIDALGVYSLANVLASVPTTVVGAVLGAVVAPLLARGHRESMAGLQTANASVRRFLYPAMALCVLGTSLAAPPFFALLYKEAYADAGWIAPLLMLSVWFALLQDAATRSYLALGDSRPLVAANTVRLAAGIGGALAGYALYELPGFIIGNAIGPLASTMLLAAGLERRGLPTLRGDLSWSVLVIAIGAAGIALPAFVVRNTELSTTVASIVVALVILGAVAALLGPRLLRDYRATR